MEEFISSIFKKGTLEQLEGLVGIGTGISEVFVILRNFGALNLGEEGATGEFKEEVEPVGEDFVILRGRGVGILEVLGEVQGVDFESWELTGQVVLKSDLRIDAGKVGVGGEAGEESFEESEPSKKRKTFEEDSIGLFSVMSSLRLG